MARFDLIDEFTSIYCPTRVAPRPHPRTRSRRAGKWIARLAPLAATAIVAIVIISM